MAFGLGHIYQYIRFKKLRANVVLMLCQIMMSAQIVNIVCTLTESQYLVLGEGGKLAFLPKVYLYAAFIHIVVMRDTFYVFCNDRSEIAELDIDPALNIKIYKLSKPALFEEFVKVAVLHRSIGNNYLPRPIQCYYGIVNDRSNNPRLSIKALKGLSGAVDLLHKIGLYQNGIPFLYNLGEGIPCACSEMLSIQPHPCQGVPDAVINSILFQG